MTGTWILRFFFSSLFSLLIFSSYNLHLFRFEIYISNNMSRSGNFSQMQPDMALQTGTFGSQPVWETRSYLTCRQAIATHAREIRPVHSLTILPPEAKTTFFWRTKLKYCARMDKLILTGGGCLLKNRRFSKKTFESARSHCKQPNPNVFPLPLA